MTDSSDSVAGSQRHLGLDKGAFSALSRREEQVLSLAAAGFLDKQIGPELGVSLNTLRTYWTRIRTKIGDGTRSALAVAYVENLTKPAEVDFQEPDWEIDLATHVFRKVSSRRLDADLVPEGETTLEERLAMIHPDDRRWLHANIESLYESDVTQFSYSARAITPSGVKMAGAYVRVIRDENGFPMRLLGHHAPPLTPILNAAESTTDVQHEGWVYDMAAGLALASDAVNRLHGLECGIPHPRDSYGKMFRPDDWAEGMKVMDEVGAGKMDTSFYRLRKLDPSDPEGVMITVHGVRGKNGKVVRVIGYRSRYISEGPKDPPPPALPRIGFWAKKLRSQEFIIPDDDFCKIYRVDPKSPTLDADIESRYRSEDLYSAYHFYDEAISEGHRRASHDFTLSFEDGSTLDIRLEIFVEFDEQGPVRVIGTVLAFDSKFPGSSPESPSGGRDELPTSHAPIRALIGRQAELSELNQLLEVSRIVTLVGTGGVGKTRLALAVTDVLADRYRDGVCVVELTSVTEATSVAHVISHALGIAEHSEVSATEAVIDHLRHKQLLLVLDNCEHVIGGCRGIAEALVRSGPLTTILATSRERLNIDIEVVFDVLPLPTPSPGTDETARSISANDAVRLFVDRAALLVPGFTVTESNAHDVAAIVRRLDGIPIAIELAAASVRSFSVKDIAERLRSQISTLEGVSAASDPRHQTLGSLFEWSYSLLSSTEQSLFRRLSIFAGSWSMEAAERVCSGIQGVSIAEVISTLCSKSLLDADPTEPGRFRFLRTIRRFAEHKLKESGEYEKIRNGTILYFVELAESVAGSYGGQNQVDLFSTIDAETENLRATLVWCESDEQSPELGLRLCAALRTYWTVRGFASGGRRRCEAALNHPRGPGSAEARAPALFAAGYLAWNQVDFAAARRHYNEAINQWRSVGDRAGEARGLHGLGILAIQQGFKEEARSLLQDSLTINRELGDRIAEMRNLNSLGNWAAAESKYDEATEAYKKALAISVETGARLDQIIHFGSLGLVALSQGDLAAADEFFNNALTLSHLADVKSSEALYLIRLAQLNVKLGRASNALDYYHSALRLLTETSDRLILATGLEGLAAVAEEAQLLVQATTLLAAAARQRSKIASPPVGKDLEERSALYARLRQSLRATAFAEAEAAGERMTAREATEYALKVGDPAAS